MNPALLQDSFDYSTSEEAEYDSLDQHAAFSANASSFDNVGSGSIFNPSGNSSAGQSSVHPLALHAPNGGYDYRPPSLAHGNNEIPFQSASTNSISPLTSSRGSSSASPSSAASSYPVQTGQYSLNPHASYNVGPHPNAPTFNPFSHPINYPQTFLQNSLEARPRLSSMPSASGMPPPSRPLIDHSPALPQTVTTIGGDFSGLVSHSSRHSFGGRNASYQISRPQSPPSVMSRSLDSSFGAGTSQAAPPFNATKSLVKLVNRNSQMVEPTIAAKIDKGFFQAEDEWVCYRRNYFAVACSFELQPQSASEQTFLFRNKTQYPILSFAMTISAKMDGEDGKTIALVQHTPKRDKGPMNEPEKKEVKPNPGGNLQTFHGNPGPLTHAPLPHCDFDCGPMAQNGAETQLVANFERMQFKRATANNGKRRAAQQYFFIFVELYAKIRNDHGLEELVKVAHRVSSKMVVRGRSPGHYSDQPRGSHMGPGAGHLGGFQAGPSHFHGSNSAASSLGSHSDATGFGSRASSYHRHQPGISQGHQLGAGSVNATSSPLHGMYLRGIPDILHGEENASDYMYGGGELGGSLGPPTPRASNAVRQSSRASPTAFPGGFGCHTPPVSKEEFRMPAIKSEDDRHHSGLKAACAMPAFHNSWQHHDSRTPPRECKPYALDINRTFYNEPALL